jgi:hypothetical protein
MLLLRFCTTRRRRPTPFCTLFQQRDALKATGRIQSLSTVLLMDSEPITYGLRGKTRAIAAVSDPTSSSVNSQFLAGTCSVRSGNEVWRGAGVRQGYNLTATIAIIIVLCNAVSSYVTVTYAPALCSSNHANVKLQQ